MPPSRGPRVPVVPERPPQAGPDADRGRVHPRLELHGFLALGRLRALLATDCCRCALRAPALPAGGRLVPHRLHEALAAAPAHQLLAVLQAGPDLAVRGLQPRGLRQVLAGADGVERVAGLALRQGPAVQQLHAGFLGLLRGQLVGALERDVHRLHHVREVPAPQEDDAEVGEDGLHSLDDARAVLLRHLELDGRAVVEAVEGAQHAVQGPAVVAAAEEAVAELAQALGMLQPVDEGVGPLEAFLAQPDAYVLEFHVVAKMPEPNLLLQLQRIEFIAFSVEVLHSRSHNVRKQLVSGQNYPG
mmetsp:Transcript_8696/g.24531  ORF Transcript_8696/g.24531 Transcript_8696/m.24531 type:complete len:302 (-) Transcript_8696:18-923(-)